MFRYRTGAAGSAAGGAAAARYFLGETLKVENEALGRYYVGETVPEHRTAMEQLARSVVAGERDFADALGKLIDGYEWPKDTAPPGILGDVARAVARDRISFADGIACLMTVWDQKNPLPGDAEWREAADRLMVWDDAAKVWNWTGPDPREVHEDKRMEAESRAADKLDLVVERIGKLLAFHLEREIDRAEHRNTLAAEGGTVAKVRADLDPRLAERLGIDMSRPMSQKELSRLLAGVRADGEAIDGKQVQKPMKSVAEVFGLDTKRLPTPAEIENVLAGRRIDGEAPVSAKGAPLQEQTIEGARKRFLQAYGLPSNTELTSDHVAHMKAGRSAIGRFVDETDVLRHLNATKNPVAYIDCIFSADKTVTLAWALAPTEAERAVILGCHRDAIEHAMAYLETHLGFTTKGKGGQDGVEPGTTCWIRCDHYTSRPTAEVAMTDKGGQEYTEFVSIPVRVPDPQLHSHSLWLNAVLTESGRIGAMDRDKLDGLVKEVGGVYQARMGRNLRENSIDATLDRETGAARILDVSSRAADHFSKRSQDLEKAARSYAAAEGHDWDTMTGPHKIKFLQRGFEATRQSKIEHDSDSDFASWRRQAEEEIGYHHRSVLRPGQEQGLRPEAERIRMAYEVSLPLIEQALAGKAKLDMTAFREFAVRGLVAAGIGDDPAADIKAIMAMYRDHGVRQDGEMTAIRFAKDAPVRGKDRWAVTTDRHVADEETVISLAKGLAADTSRAFSHEALERAARDFLAKNPKIDPADPQWIKQWAVIEQLGVGGRLGVAIGVAGAGKTTLMAPIAAAGRQDGRHVYGIARGWKQADALREAGVERKDTAAVSVFLDRVAKGRIQPDSKSLVIVDELSQISRADMLQLLRLQAERGFTLYAIGDDKQIGAIEAPVMDLLVETLGDKVPAILTSVRQSTEREREIAALFRDGKAAEAIAMKLADGTAELVAGGRAATIEWVADKWMDLTGAAPALMPSIGVASNRDAHDIGVAIRQKLQEAGKIGRDKIEIDVLMRGESGLHNMRLALGDEVRVFNRVWLKGEGQDGHFASNGDTLTILNVSKGGFTARNDEGREADITWKQLTGRFETAPRLAYGHALTIDASQGTTSRVHIDAILSGSWMHQGGKGYVNESRQRETTHLIVNEAAERRKIFSKVPRGEYRVVRDADIWAHVAANMSRPTTKALATEFIKGAPKVYRGNLIALPAALEPAERREMAGLPRMTIRRRFERGVGVPEMKQVIQRGLDPIIGRDERRQSVGRPVPPPSPAQRIQPPTQGPRRRI